MEKTEDLNSLKKGGSFASHHSSEGSQTTTSQKTSFFGLLNHDQLYNYFLSLRSPSGSIVVNVLIFVFYALLPFSSLISWVKLTRFEGKYTSIVAKILEVPFSLCIYYLGYELDVLILIFVFLLEVLTVFAFFMGYNLLMKGSELYDYVRIYLSIAFWVFLIFGQTFNYVTTSYLDCAFSVVFDSSATVHSELESAGSSCLSLTNLGFMTIAGCAWVINMLLTNLSLIFCHSTDPRQPFSIANFYLIVFNTTFLNISSILRVLPGYLFLDTVAPLFSFLSSLVSIIILFLSEPYFSYIYGAIASGLLFGRATLAILFFAKAILFNLNTILSLYDEKSSTWLVISEISPAFYIPALVSGILGSLLFLAYAGLIIWSFWNTLGKVLVLDKTGKHFVEIDTNENNPEGKPAQSSSSEQQQKQQKKRLSYFVQLAVRMQFLHISTPLKRRMQFFMTLCSNKKKFKISYSFHLEGLIFAIYFPQYCSDVENTQRSGIHKIARKQNKLNFFNRIIFHMRKHEFEKIINDDDMKKREMYRVLGSAKKKEHKILQKVQKIWKLMSNGQFGINSLVISLKKDVSNIRALYSSMIAKYPDNAEVLRNYAEFLDGIEGQTEEADILFSEANIMEEKEIKNMKRMTKKDSMDTQGRKKMHKKPILVPENTPSSDIMNEYAPMQHNEESKEAPKKIAQESDGENQSEDMSTDDDQSALSKNLTVGASAAGKNQKAQPKKEYMKKLNVKDDFFTLRMSFFIFPAVSIVLVIIALTVTMAIVNLQHIDGLYMKSKLMGLPYLLISLIRCKDIVTTMDISRNSTSIPQTCAEQFFERYKFQTNQMYLYLQIVFKTDLRDATLRKWWTTASISERNPILLSPIGASPVYNSKITLFDLVVKYSLHAAAWLTEQEHSTMQPLGSHFLYVVVNRWTIGDYAQSFLSAYMQQTADQSLLYGILIVLFVVASLIFSVFFVLFFCCVTKEFVGIRGKIVALFKRIPRETASDVYETISKQTNDENSSVGFTFVVPNRYIILLSLLIIFCGTVSILIFFGYSAVNVLLEDDNARKVVEAAGRVMASSSKISFYSGEKVLFDSISLTVEKTYGNLLKSVNDNLSELLKNWNELRFGYGLGNSGIQGYSATIDKIIAKDFAFCSDKSKLACYCMESLQKTLYDAASDFLIESNKATNGTDEKMIVEYTEIIELNLAINEKLRDLMTEFTKINESSKDTSVMIVLTILLCGLIIACCFFIYVAMNTIVDENHVVRKLLRFVPIETVESDEKLRNYVFSHELEGNNFNSRRIMHLITCFCFDKKKKVVKKERSTNDSDHAILDSCNKAVIISTTQGVINRMNPNCLKLFGFPTQTEMIGSTLKSLVTVSSRTTLSPVMRACAQSGIGNKQNLKVECVKRSGEKFPAICSLSLAHIKGRKMVILYIADITEEENHQNALDAEKANAERLLLNIFPKEIAIRVRNNEKNVCEVVDNVACLCTDMVGFTSLSSRMTPQELISMLSLVVMEFDRLTDDHEVEKIKTIGDAYIACAGLHCGKTQRVTRLVRFGSDMVTILERYNRQAKTGNDRRVEIRIGINIGRVTTGVIGAKKYIYDIWGEGLRGGEWMEKTGKANKLHISEAALNELTREGTLPEFSKLNWETAEVEIEHKKCKSYFISLTGPHSDENRNSFDNSVNDSVSESPLPLETHGSSFKSTPENENEGDRESSSDSVHDGLTGFSKVQSRRKRDSVAFSYEDVVRKMSFELSEKSATHSSSKNEDSNENLSQLM